MPFHMNVDAGVALLSFCLCLFLTKMFPYSTHTHAHINCYREKLLFICIAARRSGAAPWDLLGEPSPRPFTHSLNLRLRHRFAHAPFISERLIAHSDRRVGGFGSNRIGLAPAAARPPEKHTLIIQSSHRSSSVDHMHSRRQTASHSVGESFSCVEGI